MTKYQDPTLFLLNKKRFQIYQNSIGDSIKACNKIIQLFQSDELNLDSFIYYSELLLLNIASIPYREGRLQFDKVKGHKYILPLGLNTLNAIAKEILRMEELKDRLGQLSDLEKKFLLNKLSSLRSQTEVSNEPSSSASSKIRLFNVYNLTPKDLDHQLKKFSDNQLKECILSQKQELQNRLRNFHAKGFFDKIEKGLRQFNSLLYETTITLTTSKGQKVFISQQSAEILFQKQRRNLESHAFFMLAGNSFKDSCKTGTRQLF